MHLTPFEQSGFIIETNNGFRLALDIASKTPIEKLENLKVDAFLVSHIHGDHFSPEHIAKVKPKHVFLPKDCKEELHNKLHLFEVLPHVWDIENSNTPIVLDPTENISATVFSVDHGPNVSSPVKYNYGFLIELEGKKIYFAGDMYYESGIEVSELEVDYALIPIGGHYTFGPKEAFEFVKKFKSIKKLVPMHYEFNQEARGEFESLAGEEFDILSREDANN